METNFPHPYDEEKNNCRSVTYKIQLLDTPPFGHFMHIVHVTETPSTGAPLFKQAE